MQTVFSQGWDWPTSKAGAAPQAAGFSLADGSTLAKSVFVQSCPGISYV